MGFESRIAPGFTQMTQQAASAAQSTGAQRTQVGMQAAGFAQQSAAQMMTDLKEESLRLKISPARLMELQPAKYRGALMTITQGDKARVDGMMSDMQNYPETGAEAINWMTMNRVSEISRSDAPMFDVTEMRAIRDSVTGEEGGRTEQEAIEEMKIAAISGDLGPVMEELGYTPTKNEQGQNVWPQEAHDWFQAIGDQLDVDWSLRHSDESIQKQIMAALRGEDFPEIMAKAGEIALPQDIVNNPYAPRQASTVTPGLDISKMSGQELTTEINKRMANPTTPGEKAAAQIGGSEGRQMMMSEMSKTQTQANYPIDAPPIARAESIISGGVAPAQSQQQGIDYGQLRTTGVPTEGAIVGQREVVTQRGKVGQIQDVQARVAREAPGVASNALLEAQAIRDAKSTTALKEAQARQLNAVVADIKKGDTSKLSDQQKFIQKQMGAAFDSHLEEAQDMLNMVLEGKADKETIMVWNAKVKALADTLGIDAIDINAGGAAGLTEGNIWLPKAWEADLPFLQLGGIMNMGGMGAGLSPTGDYGGRNLADVQAGYGG